MNIGLCLEMVLLKDTLEERIRKAAEAGFKFAEMWWVDVTFKGTPEKLAEIARRHGITLTDTLINSPDGSRGGCLTDPKRRDEWLERARMTVAFTKRAGIPATIVTTGNITQGLSDKQIRQSVIEGLRSAVDIAEAAGITLLLEPLNDKVDHPGYWLTSSDKGADIVREIGSKRLRLLFDCYHMQIMEGNLVEQIRKHIDVIGHFHSAGVPGRHELFLGETNYPYLLSQIEKMGYPGTFGLEYSPSMADEVSLKQSLEYLTAVAVA